jgi:hypothetical protein
VPLALTVPLAGFCPRAVKGGITKSNATLLKTSSVPRVMRAAVKEEFLFICLVVFKIPRFDRLAGAIP